MERWDYTHYLGLLRAYSIYARTQCMLGNFMTQTLMQLDKKKLKAVQVRNKLAEVKRAETIYK